MLRTIWARRWWIVVPALVSAVVTWSAVSLLPKQYESFAVIQVAPQQVPESFVQSVVNSDLAGRVQGVQARILSRTKLERVIKDFDLYSAERRTHQMEQVIEQMRNDVRLVVGGSPTTIRVGFVSSSPRSAQRVSERLASLLMDENSRDRQNISENTDQFMETEVGEAERQLNDYDVRIAKYKTANPGRQVSTAIVIEGRVLEDSYRVLLEKKAAAKLAANLESRSGGETFRVIDPARVPAQPLGPSRAAMTGFAGLGGLAIGLVLVGTRRRSADSTVL